jgi:hypothetical protein
MFERDDAQLCLKGVMYLLASDPSYFYAVPLCKLRSVQTRNMNTFFQPRVDIITALLV